MNWPADPCDVVDAERQATLVGGERVGQDRRRVGQQARSADALHDTKQDEVCRAGAPGEPVDRQEQRSDRVDHEAEVVDPHPPEQVAEPAQADDQHACDHQEAEDHPQQVEAVARPQRVQVDAAEDVGHRDQRDRGVDRRQQHTQRRVRQGDPLVAVRPRADGRVHHATGSSEPAETSSSTLAVLGSTSNEQRAWRSR